jgi:hypothetical protein
MDLFLGPDDGPGKRPTVPRLIVAASQIKPPAHVLSASRAAPVESRGGPTNDSDADYGDLVPLHSQHADQKTGSREVADYSCFPPELLLTLHLSDNQGAC